MFDMQPKEASNCRCCKDCSVFKQIIELQNVGLVIYRYSSAAKEGDGKSDYMDMPQGDVYIVHNTSNIDIATNEYFSGLGQYIKCPRCKYLFEHAEKLMKKVNYIDKFGIIGLCDYCKDRIPCEHCYEVIKKFIASKNKETKKVNDFIQWLNNVKYCLKNNKLQSRSLSNLHLNKKRNFTLDPKIIHELRRGQFSDTDTSRDTAQTESHHQISMTGSLNGTPIGGDKTVHDTEKMKRNFFDQDSNLIEQSDIGFGIQKRKTLKFLSKYTHISQDAINVNVHDLDSINLIHRKDINYRSFHNLDDRLSDDFPYKYDYTEKYNLSRSNTEVREKIEIKKANVSSIDLNTQEAFIKIDEDLGQESPLQKDFSFVFIKPDIKQSKTPRKYKSSSELIRDTKNMIRERSEKEKTKTLPEIKLKEKNIKVLKEDDKHKKKKQTVEETKEKLSVGDTDDQKVLDIATKATEEPAPDKKIKEKTKIEKRPSHTLPKSENKQMKIEHKNKNNDKDLITADKVSTKIKKESEKREKVEKIVVEKEQKLITAEKVSTKVKKESEKRENVEKIVIEKEPKVKDVIEKKTKKEPPLDLNKKEDITSEPKKTKQEANKASSTKDNIEDFKMLLAEQKKQKEEEAKLRKKEEEEKMRNKEEEDKMKKKEEEKQIKETVIKSQDDKEPKSDKKSELNMKPETKKKTKDTGTSELKANQIKIRKPSTDDLILQLVKLKQSTPKYRVQPKRLSEINIDPTVIKTHKGHQSNKQSNCAICNDSELELDIENINRSKYESEEVTDIIIGQQIFKHKPHMEEKHNKTSIGPILFTSQFNDDVNIPNHGLTTNSPAGDMERKPFSNKILILGVDWIWLKQRISPRKAKEAGIVISCNIGFYYLKIMDMIGKDKS